MGKRHKGVCRAWKAFFEKGGATSVVEEPLLAPAPRGVPTRTGTTTQPDARADIAVCGLSEKHHFEFYDIAVIDTGAGFRDSMTSAKALEAYENTKRRKYQDRVAAHGHGFTPLVCSVYGTLAPEAVKTANQVARRVDPDRGERASACDLHAVMLQTATLKSVSLCLRARSMLCLPETDTLATPEDAGAVLADAGARDRDVY